MKFWTTLTKDQKQKIVLVAIATLTGMGLSIQFYVVQAWRNYFTSGHEITRLHGELADAESRAQKAKQQEADLQQMREFVQTQQATMVSGDSFAWIVREISLLAEKHPVRVITLRPTGTTPQASNKAMTMFGTRLEVAGTYDQLGEFIRDLENKFSTGQVRGLDVLGNVSAPGIHQANLDLVIPIRPAAAVKPAAATDRKAAAS